MPDTSAAESLLALSTPSVSTTTARRGPSCSANMRPVLAIASKSDVTPYGLMV